MNDIAKKIIMIGGGGHSQVVLDILLRRSEYNVVGILDPKIKPGETTLDIPILGNDSYLNTISPEEYNLALGIGMLRDFTQRYQIYLQYKQRGFQFPNIIHPHSQIGSHVTLSDGIQIMGGVVINPSAHIGANTILNTSSVIEHDCIIEDGTHIAPGAVLGGQVHIGKNCLIGLGSRVLPGIKIGNQVTIGAGAVVTKDIPNGQTVYGVPAH